MRVATFNIENLDDSEVSADNSKKPSFEERMKVLRPQLERLRADVLCLQEVHGQDVEGQPRTLRALNTLLEGTRYENYQIRSTTLKNKPDVEKYRNLVTLVPADWGFEEVREILHDYADPPEYNAVTETSERGSKKIKWDRPLFYCRVKSPQGLEMHVLNAHYKSKIPTPIPGQGPDNFKFKTAAGWAEGFFISSMKRVGAALETRIFLDKIFKDDENAMVVLAGDLNAESHEVPVVTVKGDVTSHGNSDLNHQMMFPCEDSVPESARFTLYHHGQKNMLDHLLVSRALMTGYRGAEIHNEFVRDESIAYAFDSKFPSSDHAPVVAEFDDEILSKLN